MVSSFHLYPLSNPIVILFYFVMPLPPHFIIKYRRGKREQRFVTKNPTLMEQKIMKSFQG